jgi:hypothetical protein
MPGQKTESRENQMRGSKKNFPPRRKARNLKGPFPERKRP